MKFAVLALAGALGMGLSAIAGAIRPHGDAEIFSGAGFVVMVFGALALIGPPVRDWAKIREERKGSSERL